MTVDAELLTLRRLAFGFAESKTSRTFYGGDEFLSQFWGSLSLLFPEGERFFVETVKHYQNEIDDPILRARIVGFAGQESMHGKSHDEFNRSFFDEGVMEWSAKRIQENLVHILNTARGRFSPRFQLGITCALEHFTAILAEQLLTMPEHQEALDPKSRRLWIWHALEELEHKSVAFDVFEKVSGTYRERALSMIAATAIFVWYVAAINRGMVSRRPDKVRFGPFVRVMLTKPGLIPRLLPVYFEYFKPGFHPHDRDTSALVEKWRAKLFDERTGALANIVERENVVMPRVASS